MKTQDYNIFWQRLHNTAKSKGFPLRVMFEVTYQCNFNCRHCYVPQAYRKYNELNTKEAFFILDELREIGCFYLGFTGGEPFVRRDFMDILWYAKKLGFEIIIYTNGSLIDERIANELARLRPNKVDITIPGVSRNTFEGISGVTGSRDKVFKAIELLYEKGVNLGFKSCVLKENEKEIMDIQKFTDSLNALHRLDDMLSPCLNGSREPFKYRGRLFNANHRQSKANSRECLNKDISVNSRAISENSRLFKCGVGISQAVITPLGELKMCLMIDYPKHKILDTEDERQQTEVRGQKTSLDCARDREDRNQRADLKGAWEKLKELVENIKPNENYQCDRCELEPYCKWCPAKSWLYNRTFISCEPESYKKAERMKQLLNC